MAYREKRPSPSISAADRCGQVAKGNDKMAYVSQPDKNGVCRWVKLPVLSEGFREKLQNAKKALAKAGVEFYQFRHFPATDEGVYVVDDVWEWAREKMGEDYMDKKWVIVVIKPSGVTRHSVMQRELSTQHTITGRDKQVPRIMKEVFGSAFEWSGKASDAMKIKAD